MPLLLRLGLAYRRKVQHGHTHALLAQLPRRADHERTLAHLPRREHVAEFALEQALDQVLVRLPFDVTRRVLPQRAAGDVEGGSGGAHLVVGLAASAASIPAAEAVRQYQSFAESLSPTSVFPPGRNPTDSI